MLKVDVIVEVKVRGLVGECSYVTISGEEIGIRAPDANPPDATTAGYDLRAETIAENPFARHAACRPRLLAFRAGGYLPPAGRA